VESLGNPGLEIADRVLVMYAGRKVEEAPVEILFRRPLHPYTQGLLASTPMPLLETAGRLGRLREIQGVVPSLIDLGEACPFSDRCPKVIARCRQARPERSAPDAASEVFCFGA